MTLRWVGIEVDPATGAGKEADPRQNPEDALPKSMRKLWQMLER